MIVTVEMDWRENMSKDFSLVIWGTGQPVSIYPNDKGTWRSSFPYTAKRADDENADEENGSDGC